MSRGQVIRIRSGKYAVEYADGRVEETVARGVLRVKSDGIVTGDYVETANGAIGKVYPARTRFVRPAVANVDVLCLVLARPPEPDFLLADKVLASACAAGAEAVIAVNKTDLAGDVFARAIREYAAAGVPVVRVSAADGSGLDDLKDLLRGKLTAFCGQSAVGKTSLLNALFGLDRRTGEVAEKTLRGRHTTTACEIVREGEFRIADTPGFSAFSCDVSPEELADCYPEFAGLTCRFRGCSHLSEPGCAVRAAVENGRIPAARYERYAEIYGQLKEQRRNRYAK